MAPLPGRSADMVFNEMREALDAGGMVKIGAPSYSHGAVKDPDGRYRLRVLALDLEKAEARRKANGGRFTPADADASQAATGAIVLEADTVEGLIALMKTGPVRVM